LLRHLQSSLTGPVLCPDLSEATQIS
jgi:hypothetical protein